MPTITRTIAQNSDDASVISGTFWLSRLEAGDGAIAGLRFQNIEVPQGTTISSATLTLIQTANFPDPGSLFANGHNANNSPTFSAFNTPADRNVTTAASTIVPAAIAGTYTVDVTAIIQEIINRAGFASGNACSIILSNRNIFSSVVKFSDYDDPTNNCSIEIKFGQIVSPNKLNNSISLSI